MSSNAKTLVLVSCMCKIDHETEVFNARFDRNDDRAADREGRVNIGYEGVIIRV